MAAWKRRGGLGPFEKKLIQGMNGATIHQKLQLKARLNVLYHLCAQLVVLQYLLIREDALRHD